MKPFTQMVVAILLWTTIGSARAPWALAADPAPPVPPIVIPDGPTPPPPPPPTPSTTLNLGADQLMVLPAGYSVFVP